jgi:hypothetical protein
MKINSDKIVKSLLVVNEYINKEITIADVIIAAGKTILLGRRPTKPIE